MSLLFRKGAALMGAILCVLVLAGCEKKYEPKGDPEPPQGPMPTKENPGEDFKPRP